MLRDVTGTNKLDGTVTVPGILERSKGNIITVFGNVTRIFVISIEM